LEERGDRNDSCSARNVVFDQEFQRICTRKLMNEHLELATAMLAVALSAVLLLAGQLYIERRATLDARSSSALATPLADAREGLDIRLISERNPYMRAER
jgi:hypothetical protein